jgi:hypothetical protein
VCLSSNLGSLGDLEIGRSWYLPQRHLPSARTIFALSINSTQSTYMGLGMEYVSVCYLFTNEHDCKHVWVCRLCSGADFVNKLQACNENILIPGPKRRRQPSGRHDSSSAPQGDHHDLKRGHTSVNKYTHLHANGRQPKLKENIHQFKRPSFLTNLQTLSSLTPREEIERVRGVTSGVVAEVAC